MRATQIRTAIACGSYLSVLLVSLGGWFMILESEHRLFLQGICSTPTGSWLTLGLKWIAAQFAINPPTELILPWFAMLLAMMPPLLTEQIAHVRFQSEARRRLRVIFLFVVAYGAVWMAAGVGLMFAAVAIGVAADAAAWPAIIPAIGVAVCWQFTPLKRACLKRCHEAPRLSPSGAAADFDCARYGFSSAIWCVGACWALMLIPLVADGLHVAAMAIVSALSIVERALHVRRRGFIRLLASDLTVLRKSQGSNT
jgi:predicted metal-binding membrane protein